MTKVEANKRQLTVVAGAKYKMTEKGLERIGKKATSCTCGQGWLTCDFCWERNKKGTAFLSFISGMLALLAFLLGTLIYAYLKL